MLIFWILLVVLAIIVAGIIFLFILKINSEYNIKTKQSVEEILKLQSFDAADILVASKNITIALNKQHNRIAVIENFNPDILDNYNYFDIITSSIVNFENSGFQLKISYRLQGEVKVISVPLLSKEAKIICHNILEKILFKRLELKYSDFKFDYFTSSDLECNYIWAYDSARAAFAYLNSQGEITHRVIKLRKEFFSVDTHYNYLELPLSGQFMQLMVWDKNFLNNVFLNILETIKEHVAPADEGQIFYDNYSDIIYLTNGYDNIQSILLDKIEEVFYHDNRISFTVLNNKKIINYPSDKEFINKFENFVISYNLRKIATSFDYKTDRLINVNTNTKFIVDITRDRVIYCANLNKFYSFSYMTFAFLSLKSADVIKAPSRNYVRIKTHDGEILDVTCLKQEVAYYVKGQIDSIINGD